MNRNLTILLIEENEDDLFFLRRAFEKCKMGNPLQEARSVSEALGYMAGNGKFSDRKAYPFPSLIISNMRIGLEVLKWIRAHPEHYVIPVLFSFKTHRLTQNSKKLTSLVPMRVYPGQQARIS